MRILIATPLYPPDIAEPAPYVKELATRMKDTHDVSILAYNHIPEHIKDVRIIAIPKYAILPIRLIRYTFTLWKEARKVDCVYVQNGPSTEFSFIFVAHITRARFIFRLGDEASLAQALIHTLRRTLLSLAIRTADTVVTHRDTSLCTTKIEKAFSSRMTIDCPRPPQRPEVLPFRDYPSEAFRVYENSWTKHVADVENIFIQS